MMAKKSRQYIFIKCPYCQQEVKENMANWHMMKKCNENQNSNNLHKGVPPTL
jgi:hypothetical protein